MAGGRRRLPGPDAAGASATLTIVGALVALITVGGASGLARKT